MNLLESTQNQEAGFVYAKIITQLPTLTHFLHAAVELNVFDIIALHGDREPVSASQIAASFPKHNVTKTSLLLERMLSLFVSFSLLNVTQNSSERSYTLTPAGKYFIRNDAEIEGSLATFILFSSESVQQHAWSSLKDAIMEGVSPCEKAFGLPIFKVMSHHSETGELFNKAMSEVSTLTMKGLLETYKGFDAIRSLVDVGGGDGSCLKMIISMNPHITGINFDMPQVLKNAPAVPGITHVGGDMFEFLPKGDAIMLKNILHNWGDEQCLTLLKLCYDAISKKNGKVIVIEAILADTPSGNNDSKDSCLRDANMFILPDGKERTREEYNNLSRSSGFSNALFISSYGIEWIMEFHK